ncbi:restriction endonuclease subunit S [Fusobacterium polymorphum]|uniref:restriction endonuclease subunit S n=1 Tax=Fusobacterium nucleatum subsp. polymorphum TaxID=76857 RepID=UPI00023264E1
MKIFKLKDISEFIRNGVTIKQDISSKEGIPITRIETISKGTIDFNKLGYANIFKIEKYKEWLLKKGDILISHINSEKHLGKSAIYLDNNYDIIHGMNLLCIRAIDKKVFPEYLQLFFKTNQYKKQIKKITKKSVNQASFSVNDFKEILITVPDLNIQEKIIKKIKVLEKILENNKLKLNYLSELTKSLFTKYSDSKIVKSFYIKDISSELFAGGDKPNDYSETTSKEYIYPVYSNGEKKEGLLCFSKTFKVDKEALTISARGTIGFTVIRKACFTPVVRLITLIPNKNNNIIYLKYAIEELNLKKLGSGVAQLTIPVFSKYKLNLPPIELQNKFAERIEKIEKLKFEIEKSIEESQKLYNSLISKYFDN